MMMELSDVCLSGEIDQHRYRGWSDIRDSSAAIIPAMSKYFCVAFNARLRSTSDA